MRSGERTIGGACRRTLGAVAAAAGLGVCATMAAGSPLILGLWVLPVSIQPPAEPQPSPAPPPAPAEPARPDSANPLNDPEVEQIIGDLERATAPRRPVDPVTPATSVPARPGLGVPLTGVRALPPAPGKLMPEGTFLPSRRGRVIRGEASEWVFHFDNDTDSDAPPPMPLLPCQTLMAMEDYALRGGEAVVLTVSGQVFVYHGRNYLLPTFFEPARRTSDLVPLQ